MNGAGRPPERPAENTITALNVAAAGDVPTVAIVIPLEGPMRIELNAPTASDRRRLEDWIRSKTDLEACVAVALDFACAEEGDA